MDIHAGCQYIARCILRLLQELKVDGNSFLGLIGNHIQSTLSRSAGNVLFCDGIHHDLFIIQGSKCKIGFAAVALHSNGLSIVLVDILCTIAFISPEVHFGDVCTYLILIVNTECPKQARIHVREFGSIHFHGVPFVHLQLIHPIAIMVIEGICHNHTVCGRYIEGNSCILVLAYELNRTIFFLSNAHRININIKGDALESSIFGAIPLHSCIPGVGGLAFILIRSTVVALIGQVYLHQ